MGIERGDVPALASAADDLDYRSAVLSRALLPADATNVWMEARQSFDADRLLSAFADVALIEAANEREEATAIAIAPPEVGAYVHELIRDSQLVSLPETGHCPQLSAPEQTAAAILSFVGARP